MTEIFEISIASWPLLRRSWQVLFKFGVGMATLKNSSTHVRAFLFLLAFTSLSFLYLHLLLFHGRRNPPSNVCSVNILIAEVQCGRDHDAVKA
jgi:hypothetical protein